jgi:hypothetical protein
MTVVLNLLLTGLSVFLFASDPNPFKLACLVVTAGCLVWSLVIAGRRA